MKAIVLLAGLSRRCGNVNKLLKLYQGSALFTYSLSSALHCCDTVAVIGHQSQMVEEAIYDFTSSSEFSHSLEVIFNPDFATGQMSSVRKGVEHIPDGEDFCILLADMPNMTADFLSSLIRAFDAAEGCDCLRPYFMGKPGHPVLFHSNCKHLILSPEYSHFTSVKKLIDSTPLKLSEFQVKESSLLDDIDFLEDFR